MEFEHLILEREAGIGTITFNRPQVRNALNEAAWQELGRAVELLAADPAVQVVILTGAGDEAFVAGADIQWLHDRSMLSTLDAVGQRVLAALEGMAKPSIAAVNGFALGGGCEVALACDMRIASDRAKFGQPEVRLGLLPGAGGCQRLTRLVGVAKAKELIFTGDIVDAVEAERIGMVNRIVPHADLPSAAKDLARKIMQRGPLAVRLAKVAIDAGVNLGPGAGYLSEVLGQTVLFATEDRLEGTGAFLEKRRPDFRGR
jgi:enoyl-CoA hydratase